MASAKITMDDLLAQAGDNIKQIAAGDMVNGTDKELYHILILLQSL